MSCVWVGGFWVFLWLVRVPVLGVLSCAALLCRLCGCGFFGCVLLVGTLWSERLLGLSCGFVGYSFCGLLFA